jgi:hypothetical protein
VSETGASMSFETLNEGVATVAVQTGSSSVNRF